MSTSVSTSFVKQFEKEVHEAFQRFGTLMLSGVRWKSKVIGSSTTFQKIGKGVATTKARHGTITPMNQTHTAIECTLSDFFAGDWVDKLDENKLEINEREAIARGGAAALGRKVDSQIITAAETTSLDEGSNGTFSRVIMQSAVEALDEQDVPNDMQRFGYLTARQWHTAMTFTQFASSDFIGSSDLPFLKGHSIRTWLGVHWMMHNGLGGRTTGAANGLLWHKTGIGYASNPVVEGANQSVSSDITWHGDRASHFVNNMMSGGSCLIDGNGVVIISTNDGAAIP